MFNVCEFIYRYGSSNLSTQKDRVFSEFSTLQIKTLALTPNIELNCFLSPVFAYGNAGEV